MAPHLAKVAENGEHNVDDSRATQWQARPREAAVAAAQRDPDGRRVAGVPGDGIRPARGDHRSRRHRSDRRRLRRRQHRAEHHLRADDRRRPPVRVRAGAGARGEGARGRRTGVHRPAADAVRGRPGAGHRGVRGGGATAGVGVRPGLQRRAARPDGDAGPLLPAADPLLRGVHAAGPGAGGARPVRRDDVDAGAQQPRRHRGVRPLPRHRARRCRRPRRDGAGPGQHGGHRGAGPWAAAVAAGGGIPLAPAVRLARCGADAAGAGRGVDAAAGAGQPGRVLGRDPAVDVGGAARAGRGAPRGRRLCRVQQRLQPVGRPAGHRHRLPGHRAAAADEQGRGRRRPRVDRRGPDARPERVGYRRGARRAGLRHPRTADHRRRLPARRDHRRRRGRHRLDAHRLRAGPAGLRGPVPAGPRLLRAGRHPYPLLPQRADRRRQRVAGRGLLRAAAGPLGGHRHGGRLRGRLHRRAARDVGAAAAPAGLAAPGAGAPCAAAGRFPAGRRAVAGRRALLRRAVRHGARGRPGGPAAGRGRAGAARGGAGPAAGAAAEAGAVVSRSVR
ncbi:putative Proposed peptidoglycan lipid II flippase MurJ [Actinacidiphila bryophytorum]|uniref:Proposed peptidoglycan lipid II flippase MurJ n=1 Tax=Actinacidiphila bryophytorum TaxID=1436133 RepID=A0A9W4GZ62_9ACTN|nr:putative Proposed peptidoglycan lipid II flippase MurJ [Actinacidiphila bryophytorum]